VSSSNTAITSTIPKNHPLDWEKTHQWSDGNLSNMG
jgi:hypothetical protein